MRTVTGNHVVTKENAHEYADVTEITGNGYIHAACPALTRIGRDGWIYAACPALTRIGRDGWIYAACPALTSIGRDGWIYAACPALTSIGVDGCIHAACPALTSIGGDGEIHADCPALTSIGGLQILSAAENKVWRKAVAEAILANPESFDMSDWHSDCGTTHCLAGEAQLLAPTLELKAAHPSTAGAVMLGVDVAPMFYKKKEEVLPVVREWAAL